MSSHVVTFSQHTAPTPAQPKKTALPIPIKWQVIGDNGPLMEPQLTVLRGEESSVSYPRLSEPHSLSVLQDFSAPVRLKTQNTTEDHLRLMANDPNAFNRWEAGQTLAKGLLQNLSRAIETGEMPTPDRALSGYVGALKRTLDDNNFEHGFKALTLTPPSDMNIIQSRRASDPIAVTFAGDWLKRAVADHLSDDLLSTYHILKDDGPFSPDRRHRGPDTPPKFRAAQSQSRARACRRLCDG